MESWKRAPTRPTRPAWRRDRAEKQPATDQRGKAPHTPEALPSVPLASAPRPSYAMPERLTRVLRRWGEDSAVVGAVPRDHG